MSHTFRSMAATTACLLWAASVARKHLRPRRLHHPTRPPVRRRRHSWATPASGSCRRVRCFLPANGRRAATGGAPITYRGTRTSPTSPGRSRIGVKDRAEIFGSFLFDTRIDRDLRPLFGTETDFAGIIDRYPGVHTTWTGDNVGDFYVGAKFNIWSQYRQTAGGHGRARHAEVSHREESTSAPARARSTAPADFIVSKEIARVVEVSRFAGYQYRGAPGRVRYAEQARSSGASERRIPLAARCGSSAS